MVLHPLFDIIYFNCTNLFNGNAQFLSRIDEHEVIPDEEHSFLTILSWDSILRRNVPQYIKPITPSISLAYIPKGEHQIYYQGTFNGGRTEEYIKLHEACAQCTDDDYARGVIASVHDESHLNRQLVGKKVKIVDVHFSRPEEWLYPVKPKLIFRDKNKLFSSEAVRKFKNMKKGGFLQMCSIIVRNFFKGGNILFLSGELEDRMLQHAFCWAKRKSGENIQLFKMSSDNSENKNELERLFGIWVTPDKKAEAVFNLLNKSKGRFIRNAIFQMCGIRLHKNPPTYTEGNENKVTKNKIGYSFYYGKWDYEHFFSEYRTDIIRNFSFDQGLLSQRSKEVLSQINNSESVSVLIEKGTHQLDFYTQAIEQISKLVSSPRLFLFIDDPDWSEANFVANNTVIVDFNIGTDRWMNLFLMTQCKHNI